MGLSNCQTNNRIDFVVRHETEVTKVLGTNNHYKIVSGSKKRYIKIDDLSGPKHEQLLKLLEFCMLSSKQQTKILKKQRIDDATMEVAYKRATTSPVDALLNEVRQEVLAEQAKSVDDAFAALAKI